MAEIGQYNTLRVVKKVDFGVYLDGEEMGEVLMPKRYVPEDLDVDQEIEVFVYLDSEDRFIATTEKPHAEVGDFCLLKVAAVNEIGAFMDWGLMKDLFVPFREQKAKMQEGRSYLVFIMLDFESQRIVGSSRIEKFLDNIPPDYKPWEEVDLIIYEKTDLGYKAIINQVHLGMIYENEIFQELKTGQELKGYIKQVREDEKIDLSIQKLGYANVEGVSGQILEKIKESGGSIDISDKSPAELIYDTFGISKKSFKKALGKLYKDKLIVIEKDKVSLV